MFFSPFLLSLVVSVEVVVEVHGVSVLHPRRAEERRGHRIIQKQPPAELCEHRLLRRAPAVHLFLPVAVLPILRPRVGVVQQH